jgi:hypothetical protein
MKGDSNQDGEAALSTVESFLGAAETEFPFIKSCVISCSDNAGCYRKKKQLFGYAVLNLIKGSSIHSATQDGKCLLDATLLEEQGK